MAEPTAFHYAAIDSAGRRVRGLLHAASEAAAFEALRTRGLTPLSLRRTARAVIAAKAAPPPARESAEFLGSLADLLRAGADIRTALNILGGKTTRPALQRLAKALVEDISGGDSLDRAFARGFQGRLGFVPSMVAAGEAAGDLPGALQRAAEVLQSRLKIRDQLISVLAYPMFVLASAVVAVFVILLFIIPTIAPLAEDTGSEPPRSLSALIVASEFLRGNLSLLGGLFGCVALLLALAGRMGLLSKPWEAVVFEGPARRTVCGVVFGSFAVSLGTMLAAGAPMTDALRLANRAVMTQVARRRLEPLATIVRQGLPLTTALEEVRGFPPAIIRLAAVGEATNALGPMLSRAGRLEEETALRRIEAAGRLAGPALIVFLGLLLGVVMGSLLSGVSQMGQSALG
jgi:type II secretory pathway component PulF